MREIKFEFIFKHPKSEEIKIERFTLQEIIEQTDDDLLMLECDCEPIGETNVVECNCEDYLEGFELIDKRQYTGRKDKNGKEIYEGDCLEDRWGNKHVVVWDNKQAKFMFVAGCEYATIAGNIYENPEFLTDAS